MPYLLAITSIGDAISEFTTIFSSVWTFLTSNWYFSALIIVPIAGLIISTILGFIRGAR
ncbi:MAG: hypothetical protein J1E36_03845 [Eubacterium sp.]|nr:hypothetical protein [Eubacterium sp.]